MKNIILFDPVEARDRLLPLTLTRPVALIRHGITTISEKWQKAIPGAYSYSTQDYLSMKYPMVEATDGDNLFIAGNLHPDSKLVEAILALNIGEALTFNGETIARRGNGNPTSETEYDGTPFRLSNVWDIFMLNDEAIRRDFELLTAGRSSRPLSDSCRLIGDPSQLFIEEGATVECANINVSKGPVYIGRDAEVMEGACLRGPIAMCEHSVVNMGGKIYGATTLGPYCKVGGELNNVVMTGFSNKAHDGFLGNAVIGEWCNLGAGCTASNLKNTYAPVKLWSMAEGRFIKTDLQFCGLIMGDHSKAGINTMFNTATVIGVGVNFYGAGFPRTYLPSFTEGSPLGMKPVIMDRFFDTASRMMSRRHKELTPIDKEIYINIREQSAE
ncbi:MULTISPECIES: putative sugar nucleotidyl transferase [Duncaniella]|jgi:UDP-N-acetylglucosamine diphosphorylase/glucosamine-1-phosphate N-acetyltransferase|uniref:putative sugar nucleotidyl transferase n=2 Tax=Muribaculaceae TaxID=2005473 RepID=UPI001A1EE7AE|nr:MULTISPECIES: putative sugar nucleotidyl transferase [Duncaniella]MBJ2189923.1 glucose-1-phosphate thymidylyltransferase [Muribaculaceae bacterium]